MSFHFRLASVLRHRRRLEDAQALALARDRALEAAAGEALSAARHVTRDARATLGDAAFIGTTGAALGDLALRVHHAERGADTAGQDLATAQAQSEAARAALVEAAQARRTLERLEEVQRAAHRRAAQVREQKSIDEVAALYHRGPAADEEVSR